MSFFRSRVENTQWYFANKQFINLILIKNHMAALATMDTGQSPFSYKVFDDTKARMAARLLSLEKPEKK